MFQNRAFCVFLSIFVFRNFLTMIKVKHLGKVLSDLIDEYNPSRKELAHAMGITVVHMNRLRKKSEFPEVYFVLACLHMKVDYKPYVKLSKDIEASLLRDQTIEKQRQKIEDLEKEVLRLYRQNTNCNTEINQLKELVKKIRTGTSLGHNDLNLKNNITTN